MLLGGLETSPLRLDHPPLVVEEPTHVALLATCSVEAPLKN
jgi:hypothetical protein